MPKLAIYLLIILTFIAYASAMASYLFLFLRGGDRPLRSARPLLLAGVVLNLLVLLAIWLFWGHFPLIQAGEALLTATLLFFAVYLVIEIMLQQQGLGVFILGVGLTLFTVAVIRLERTEVIPTILEDDRFIVHVLFALLGYAALLIAAIASGLYLMLRRQLRAKRLGALYRNLPPLEALDRMGFRATVISFGMLSLGIMHGIIFMPSGGLELDLLTRQVHPPVQMLAAGVLWVMNGIYLYGRWIRRWQRRQVAWLSVATLAALLASIALLPLLIKAVAG